MTAPNAIAVFYMAPDDIDHTEYYATVEGAEASARDYVQNVPGSVVDIFTFSHTYR